MTGISTMFYLAGVFGNIQGILFLTGILLVAVFLFAVLIIAVETNDIKEISFTGIMSRFKVLFIVGALFISTAIFIPSHDTYVYMGIGEYVERVIDSGKYNALLSNGAINK